LEEGQRCYSFDNSGLVKWIQFSTKVPSPAGVASTSH
jgi:hypothetical protein